MTEHNSKKLIGASNITGAIWLAVFGIVIIAGCIALLLISQVNERAIIVNPVFFYFNLVTK